MLQRLPRRSWPKPAALLLPRIFTDAFGHSSTMQYDPHELALVKPKMRSATL
jgi:hypothetical protein